MLLLSAAAVVVAQDAPKRRNAIVFVADGLRHGSVNAIDTPALYRIRTEGVYFANSHAVFPTQTMPNAAAIATGHYPGDTGQFANQILIRVSAVHERHARAASGHDGARRRGSAGARGHQPAVRRQLPPRGVAGGLCPVVRLQHRGHWKDRASRFAGSVGGLGAARADARAGHHHPRRCDGNATRGSDQRSHARAAESGRPAAGAAAATPIRRDEHGARHARRERRAISSGSPTRPPGRYCRRSRKAPSRSCSSTGRAIRTTRSTRRGTA